jgi:hypothetical protein
MTPLPSLGQICPSPCQVELFALTAGQSRPRGRVSAVVTRCKIAFFLARRCGNLPSGNPHRVAIRRPRSWNGTVSSVVAPSGRPNITPSSDRARGYDLGSAGSHASPPVCPLCRALGGARSRERSGCEHPLETNCPASNSWLPRRVRGAGCRPWARPYGPPEVVSGPPCQ